MGVVTEADTVGVDRFAQLRHVMSTELHTVPADADPRTGFDRLSAGRRRLAPVVDGDGRLVGVLTRQGALRATLYTPAVDDRGRLRIAAAVGINGDVTGKAAALLEAGVDTLVVDTAHGHQERMISGAAGGPQAGPGRAGGGRQRGHRRRGTRPGRGGRGHRQGGRRAGRDVHHPDDDRGGPPAVLRGARLRGGGPGAGPARLGRRRRTAPAGRGAGARGRARRT